MEAGVSAEVSVSGEDGVSEKARERNGAEEKVLK